MASLPAEVKWSYKKDDEYKALEKSYLNILIKIGMSKKFKLGVVGDPIEHSLSPFIHSRFSRNENVNINYLAYKVNNDDFDIFIKEFFKTKKQEDLI